MASLSFPNAELSNSSSSGDGIDSTRSEIFDQATISDKESTTTTPLAQSPCPLCSVSRPMSSHDISGISNHIPSLSHLAEQIQSATAEAWDRRCEYKQVFSLLLHWEDDDLKVAPEVESLGATLRDVYNYKTETWKIPSKRPDWDIKERLIRFLRANDAQGNLVVFYYAGHAVPNPQIGGAPLWCSRRTHGKTMFSGSILSTIEEAESDFLLLFDCCNAYHPPNRPSGSGRNIIEVISAVGFGGGAVAAEPGTDSFTYHLDEALALAKRHGPIKAVDLYMHIINRLFPEAPARLRSGSTFVVDGSGPVEQRSRRQCPVHYWLSGRDKSITLAPLSKAESPHAGKGDAKVDLSSKNHSSVEISKDLAESGVVQVTRARFPQVLVAFRVSKDILDVDAWVAWLLEAPLEAQDLIKIEGFYGSFSSLLLVNMPVPVWAMMPASESAMFVGFTTTDNQAPNLQRDIEIRLLSERRRRFFENSRGGNATDSATASSGPVRLNPVAPKPTRLSTQNPAKPEMVNWWQRVGEQMQEPELELDEDGWWAKKWEDRWRGEERKG
jgi:hypothetical protein